MRIKYGIALILFVLLLLGNQSCEADKKPLGYVGHHKELGDSIEYYKIPDFSFVSQDSVPIDNAHFADNIYIADFFFTSCPSICPKVKQQMLRIYERFEDETRLKFVSHTLDPKRDTIAKLKAYANKLDIDHNKWYFVTGDKDHLYEMAEAYFVSAYEDDTAPGGFDHSGKLLLVDQDRHIRSFAEGTDPESVTAFFNDIEWLLNASAK